MYAFYVKHYTVLDFRTDAILSVPKCTVRKAVLWKSSKEMCGVV